MQIGNAITEKMVLDVIMQARDQGLYSAITQLPGETVDGPALVDWTNARVAAKFQRLAGAVILDEFPRNVAGKTLKREIRDRYLAKDPE